MFREVDHNMPFVIGSPLVGWKCERGEGLSWLRNAVEVKEMFPRAQFFAALETDAKGLEPYQELLELLKEVNGTWWTYSLNDNESKVTSYNRWIRIEMGRNLVREYAQRGRLMSGNHWGEETPQEDAVNFEAIFYIDSDMVLEADHISKLMEVDHPMVGLNVPAYCLTGKVINEEPLIEEHWNTAGSLWVNSPAYYELVWQHNSYMNLSDDPATQYAMERLKMHESEDTWGQTWVRKDVSVEHEVPSLVSIEDRDVPDREL
jgi:hypothetical protein